LKITSKSSDEAIAEDKRRQERQSREDKLKSTAKLIEPIAGDLRQLPKDQVEEVVLWLKTLHDAQPDWDVESQETERFVTKLEAIRDSTDQHELQREAAKSNVWAITCGSGAGILLSLAIVTGLVTARWLVPALLIIPVMLLFGKGFRLGARAINISKTQERKFWLLAQQEARSVKQLYKAGLFGFPSESEPVPYEDEITRRTDKILLPMRDAMYRRAGEGGLHQYLEKETQDQDEDYAGDDYDS
jgi:hypothetical protein